MSNILIVDDDKNFLLSLAEGLRTLEEDFEIFTAENGEEATEILNSTSIDLTISDLKMPKMDGFELLAFISRSYPDMPVIVITAFGNPEIEERLNHIGSFQYLEKPLDFNILVESIYSGLEARSSGYIKGISLASFLQLLETEKKTCTLRIKSKEKKGLLFFHKGTLTDAETNGHEGLDAALEIISWETAEIEIDWKCKKKSKKIDTSLDFVIMEAFRKKDEELHRQRSVTTNKTGDMNNINNSPPLSDLEEVQYKTNNSKNKEAIVNVSKLNEAVKTLKEDLGDGLISTDICFTQDGQSIAAYNSQPEATALLTQLTVYLIKTLRSSKFPSLGKFYLMDLEDDKMGVVIPMGDYQWGMLVDTSKTQLGLLLNVAIPRAIDVFEEAIAG